MQKKQLESGYSWVGKSSFCEALPYLLLDFWEHVHLELSLCLDDLNLKKLISAHAFPAHCYHSLRMKESR